MTILKFCDTETTGLERDDFEPEVIAFACVDWDDGKVTIDAERYYMPRRHPDAEVCRINGFSTLAWQARGATDFDATDAEGVASLLKGAQIVGSNPDFDKRRLAFECRRAGQPTPAWHHRSCNLSSYGFIMKAAGVLEGTGLSDLVKHFGITSEGRHDALGDCLLGIKIFEAFIDAFVMRPKVQRQALEAIAAATNDPMYFAVQRLAALALEVGT